MGDKILLVVFILCIGGFGYLCYLSSGLDEKLRYYEKLKKKEAIQIADIRTEERQKLMKEHEKRQQMYEEATRKLNQQYENNKKNNRQKIKKQQVLSSPSMNTPKVINGGYKVLWEGKEKIFQSMEDAKNAEELKYQHACFVNFLEVMRGKNGMFEDILRHLCFLSDFNNEAHTDIASDFVVLGGKICYTFNGIRNHNAQLALDDCISYFKKAASYSMCYNEEHASLCRNYLESSYESYERAINIATSEETYLRNQLYSIFY